MSQNFQNFVDVQIKHPDAKGGELYRLCEETFETDIVETTTPAGHRVYSTVDLVAVQHSANLGDPTVHAALKTLYGEYLDMLLDLTQERLRGHILARGDRPLDPQVVSRTPVLFTRDGERMVVHNDAAAEMIKEIAKSQYMSAITQSRARYKTHLAEPLSYVVFGISTTVDYDELNRPAITFILDISAYRFGDESRQTSELVHPLDNWAARPIGHLTNAEQSLWRHVNVRS